MMKATDTRQMETAAEALIAALADNGVEYFFGNAGTDFPSVIEAFAKAEMGGGAAPRPITVPHENMGLAMAHGAYLATGRPQAVMLHVNVGTANAICALLNASRENAPILLAAGRSPVMEAGAKGARSVFIHWGQEMFDQAGMVREAVKWEYELRRPDQVGQVVNRALSLAMSAPRGPVYLTLPREVLAAGPAPLGHAAAARAAAPPAPDEAALREAATWIAESERAVLITASLGRTPEEVAALASFAESAGVGIVAYRPRYMALPNRHPCHLGFESAPLIKEADLILVAECDVPWIPAYNEVNPEARIVHLGVDPLFERYPMRSFPLDLAITGEPAATLNALTAAVAGGDAAALAARRDWVAARRRDVEAGTAALAKAPAGQTTPAWLAHCLAGIQRPDDVFVTEIPFPLGGMRFERPGTYFQTPSAGGLGWGLGAALGLKLGNPDRRVIASVGDGSYMFGNPTPAHYVARALGLPTLTIVMNNGMWAAVRRATLSIHPDGAAAKSNRAPLTYLDPAPDYEVVVTASGGHGERVETAAELPAALERALQVVEEEGRSAVLNVLMPYSDEEAKRDVTR
jgi:acetolactate synthase I/II/III large subunit